MTVGDTDGVDVNELVNDKLVLPLWLADGRWLEDAVAVSEALTDTVSVSEELSDTVRDSDWLMDPTCVGVSVAVAPGETDTEGVDVALSE